MVLVFKEDGEEQKSAGAGSVDGDYFQRKSEGEACSVSSEHSGHNASDWQIVRRRRRTKNAGVEGVLGEKFQRDSEEHSESSENCKHGDSKWHVVRERKRRRKTDRGGMQELERTCKRSTDETDNDKYESGKDLEHEICVISWNVNKSSAHYDFLCDMIQCQAIVVMFQHTQNWHDDGSAEEWDGAC